jgi:cytochrome c-type biogenesis protein
MDVAHLPAPAAIGVALAAGATSFLSPCVAPLLPGYVAYVAPDGARVTRAIGFVAGFTLLFALLGLGAASVSRSLLAHRTELEIVSGLLVALAGLTMVFERSFIPASWAARSNQHAATRSAPANALAAMPIGAAFALAWSPCIGPALAAILALAADDARPAYGALLLVVYGIGLGAPFILATLALERTLRVTRRLRAHTRAIRIGAGVVVVAMGLAIASGTFGTIAAHLAANTPRWLA